MNKFSVIIALSAVLVGLVAIGSVSGNKLPKKFTHEENVYEQEGGELVKHRHTVHHPHKVHKQQPHYYRPRPKHHKRQPPKKFHHHYPQPEPTCECGGDQGFEFDNGGDYNGAGEEHEHGHGGQGGVQVGVGGGSPQGGYQGSQGGSQSGSQSGSQGGNQGGSQVGNQGGSQGGNQGGEHGSFKGAGVFGGFRKEKEFDVGVRDRNKQKNRTTFQKQKTFVAGDQKAVNGGSSSFDTSDQEGFHRHRNVNNDRLVVKENNRGTDETDGFRNQNSHGEEDHFGASENKFVGAQAGDSFGSEQDNENDFEADLHKKSDVGAFGGAGVVGGRF